MPKTRSTRLSYVRTCRLLSSKDTEVLSSRVTQQTEATYAQALQRVGGADAAGIAGNQNLSSEQLQAVGQAVAARNNGGQIGLATKHNGTGAKEAPLYVVVEESLGSTVFRWVKFLLYFGFFTYMSLVLITILVETTGVLKNIRGPQNNEAQPQQQTVRFSDVHGCDEARMSCKSWSNSFLTLTVSHPWVVSSPRVSSWLVLPVPVKPARSCCRW